MNNNEIQKLFYQQKAYSQHLKKESVGDRLKKLKILEKSVLVWRERLKQALYEDLKKPAVEADFSEIFQVLTEVRKARKNLRYWTKPKSVNTPLTLFGSSASIHYEPKGVVLIISPWNYPINLTLVPLVGALAAGNAVIIKPSEISKASSKVILDMIEDSFDQKQVKVIEGGQKVAEEILKLPFDHIFFTGSALIGKKIMMAASQNLSDITLELGGKSPTIVDQSANLKTSAHRIIWGKFVNMGQTCIAPDYILVHRSIKEKFLNAMKKEMEDSTCKEALDCNCLGRIINSHNYDRLMKAKVEAKKAGAIFHQHGNDNKEELYLAPSIVENTPLDEYLMIEEIFGPYLPVIEYEYLEGAIELINKKDKPLALYMYSKNNRNIKKVKEECSAGAMVINHGMIHFANAELPFGGVNQSGLGKYHGRESFLTFSNSKAVVKQWMPLTVTKVFDRPYSGIAKRMLEFMVRWM